MLRKTKFIVYVDKDVMTKPTELADAVIAHLIKKELDIRERKVFLAQFIKAPTEKHQMAVIESWVQVRDIVDFPFRKEAQDGKAPEGDGSFFKGGELMASSGGKMTGAAKEFVETTHIEASIAEEEQDDDVADGEPERG